MTPSHWTKSYGEGNPAESRDAANATVILIGEWPSVEPYQGTTTEQYYVMVHCPPTVRALQRAIARNRIAWLLIGVCTEEKSIELLVRAAQVLRPELPLAILGPINDPARCRRWLHRGCVVYLDASSSAQQVFAALRLAKEMNCVLMDQRFWDRIGRDWIQPLAELTKREREIIQLVRRGLRNTDIAAELGLAKSTVEFHVGNVLEKLAARNRAEAVDRAVELGL